MDDAIEPIRQQPWTFNVPTDMWLAFLPASRYSIRQSWPRQERLQERLGSLAFDGRDARLAADRKNQLIQGSQCDTLMT